MQRLRLLQLDCSPKESLQQLLATPCVRRANQTGFTDFHSTCQCSGACSSCLRSSYAKIAQTKLHLGKQDSLICNGHHLYYGLLATVANCIIRISAHGYDYAVSDC